MVSPCWWNWNEAFQPNSTIHSLNQYRKPKNRTQNPPPLQFFIQMKDICLSEGLEFHFLPIPHCRSINPRRPLVPRLSLWSDWAFCPWNGGCCLRLFFTQADGVVRIGPGSYGGAAEPKLSRSAGSEVSGYEGKLWTEPCLAGVA